MFQQLPLLRVALLFGLIATLSACTLEEEITLVETKPLPAEGGQ